MEAIDRQIVLLTQQGLPLVERPYLAIAEQLGVSEDEVMERFRFMLEKGIVRRIAAVPNHYKLGYIFNGMTVWDLDDQRIEKLGPTIAALPFVSHCYQRPRHLPEWPYNLFAMIHAKTEAEAIILVQQIADLLGSYARSYQVLYSTKILKKTGLRI